LIPLTLFNFIFRRYKMNYDDEFPENEVEERSDEGEISEGEEEEDEDEKLYEEIVHETLGKPKKYADEYIKYWTEVYGIPENLPERAKYFREAELRRKGGPGGVRKQREIELRNKVEARKVAPEVESVQKIKKAYGKYKCEKPCENLSEEKRKRGDPAQRIRYQIKDKKGVLHCVCYDVTKLYVYLIINYGRDSFGWKDPTYGTFIPDNVKEKINKRWDKLNLCGNQLTKLRVVDSRQTQIPKNIYENAILDRNTKYLAFRVSNKSGDYFYEVATAFLDRDDEIGLPANTRKILSVKEGDFVWIQECFHLPKLDYLLLQPLDAKWNKISVSEIESIEEKLTKRIESNYITSIGDVIEIPYQGEQISLFIVDAKSGKKRVPVGITKFTSVEIDFRPYSAEGKIYW
jgi:hypothetical protein